MKVYNKNGFLSRVLRAAVEWMIIMDAFLAAGTLFGLITCILSGDPVPAVLRMPCWIILGGNAAALLLYAVYVLRRESRKIRMGVLSPDMICAIMEGKI